VVKAASEVNDQTTTINQLYRIGFTYLKVPGWLYLGMILHDCRRDIISWKRCANMGAEDVTRSIWLCRRQVTTSLTSAHKHRLLGELGGCAIGPSALLAAAQVMSQASRLNGCRAKA
jgi:hypothetical protein